jgi:hypothetical protein
VKSSKAEKLLKKIERDLARGSTFAYKTDDVKSLNRVLDKACDASSKAIGEIRAYFTSDASAKLPIY